MKAIIHLCLFAAILLTLPTTQSCQDENPPEKVEPRPKTNHMKALINGQEWESCRATLTSIPVGADIMQNYLLVEGSNLCDDSIMSIGFKLNYVAEDSFLLDNFHYGFVNGPTRNSSGSQLKHQTNHEHSGYVVITEIDSTERTVSGYFEFDALSEEGHNLVKKVRKASFNKVFY